MTMVNTTRSTSSISSYPGLPTKTHITIALQTVTVSSSHSASTKAFSIGTPSARNSLPNFSALLSAN